MVLWYVKLVKEISDDYLIINHYISKRGNEDDYCDTFYYDCSKDRKAWKDHYAGIELEKRKREIEHSKNIIKAIEIIKKSSRIEFTINEYNEECVVIS